MPRGCGPGTSIANSIVSQEDETEVTAGLRILRRFLLASSEERLFEHILVARPKVIS